WSKPAGASTAELTLLSGSALPVPARVRTLDLVGAGVGGTASRVALTSGTGYFTQSVDDHSAAGATGATGPLFWVSDTGVRYGLDAETATEKDTDACHGKTVSALGLNPPALAIPWSVLSLFAPGPTLSCADALRSHDGLAPDQQPGRRASGGETR
ncbi:MAG: type VII secretion protein EccB, partial [Mycobacterium sp.]